MAVTCLVRWCQGQLQSQGACSLIVVLPFHCPAACSAALDWRLALLHDCPQTPSGQHECTLPRWQLTAPACLTVAPTSRVPCHDHTLGLLQGVLPEQDLNTLLTAKHRPNYCLRVMGELFNQCSYLSENEFVRLDTQMTCFADYLGAMERIFKSPIPLPYTRWVLGIVLQRVAAQTQLQGCSPEYLGAM